MVDSATFSRLTENEKYREQSQTQNEVLEVDSSLNLIGWSIGKKRHHESFRVQHDLAFNFVIRHPNQPSCVRRENMFALPNPKLHRLGCNQSSNPNGGEERRQHQCVTGSLVLPTVKEVTHHGFFRRVFRDMYRFNRDTAIN